MINYFYWYVNVYQYEINGDIYEVVGYTDNVPLNEWYIPLKDVINPNAFTKPLFHIPRKQTIGGFIKEPIPGIHIRKKTERLSYTPDDKESDVIDGNCVEIKRED